MNPTQTSNTGGKGTVWYYLGGALSLIVGLIAIAFPVWASVTIAQVIGIFCVVSGVALLVSALFGRAKNHRVLDFFSAALRVVVGVLLLVKVVQGVMALTLLLAAVFLAEGLYGSVLAFKMRGKNPAWTWILINSLVAFVLGGMLLAKFPSDTAWAIGLLFGINSVFLGVSLIMFGRALPKSRIA